MHCSIAFQLLNDCVKHFKFEKIILDASCKFGEILVKGLKIVGVVPAFLI